VFHITCPGKRARIHVVKKKEFVNISVISAILGERLEVSREPDIEWIEWH
jgi:hypothetical protein